MSTGSYPAITITSPFIPPSSLILVTGANGLIASHIVDQLLAAGYLVRGTVRSASRCSYLTALFNTRHGPNRFELFEVPDVTAPGAWDVALKGVSGIAHVIGPVDFYVQDVDAAVAKELVYQIPFLEAVAREESVKAVAWTSSAWTAWTPDAKRKITLTEESWNDEAVELAREGANGKELGWTGFMALKTILEKSVWEWVREKKPKFAFNTVLLDTVLGDCLDPVNQGYPSSAGMVHRIWKNENVSALNMIEPQWFVDCRDAGRLYVALLGTSPVVDGERIFGFGARYSWFRVAEILKELYPDHVDKVAKLQDRGWDQTEVPNQRGAELLVRLGQQSGWRSLEESVKENARRFPEFEK
ncbi:Aldehyde reductase 2 [Madurella mycetomatis]|uniref:Aldehyde reductase 2 n=1 Tax=Madurella mycetomatis TaxID=100816 RepID=A0A175W309_9PEZI|nr:Aldehyde reductase 2 [Madurella mycetomatis]